LYSPAGGFHFPARSLLRARARIFRLYQRSRESSPRIRRSQGANPVTGEALSVHPSGHPISISRKRGDKPRVAQEHVGPGCNVTWTGGEEGQIARSLASSGPSAEYSRRQNNVQFEAVEIKVVWCSAWNLIPPIPTVIPLTCWNSDANGVGQDEEPAAVVGRADFSR